MKLPEMFVIVTIIAVGMFGLIYMSGNSISPLNVTNTFGETAIPSHISIVNISKNTTNTTDPNANITFENTTIYTRVANDSNNSYIKSYDLVQNVTAAETQGAGAGIIIVAACVVILLIFAAVVTMRGQYSKGKYRT